VYDLGYAIGGPNWRERSERGLVLHTGRCGCGARPERIVPRTPVKNNRTRCSGVAFRPHCACTRSQAVATGRTGVGRGASAPPAKVASFSTGFYVVRATLPTPFVHGTRYVVVLTRRRETALRDCAALVAQLFFFFFIVSFTPRRQSSSDRSAYYYVILRRDVSTFRRNCLPAAILVAPNGSVRFVPRGRGAAVRGDGDERVTAPGQL
jgi:hypothetical protein